jgi:hypothetical protein
MVNFSGRITVFSGNIVSVREGQRQKRLNRGLYGLQIFHGDRGLYDQDRTVVSSTGQGLLAWIDFLIAIAIPIAIKIFSGKTGDRFSFQIRSAISGSKSIPDFYFKIDPRLKNGFWNKNGQNAQSNPAIYAPPSTFARNAFPSGLANNGSSDSANTALRSAMTFS